MMTWRGNGRHEIGRRFKIMTTPADGSHVVLTRLAFMAFMALMALRHVSGSFVYTL
ncbi:MAG: hypothetical protein ACK5YO_22460 [Planctomyces sp.]